MVSIDTEQIQSEDVHSRRQLAQAVAGAVRRLSAGGLEASGRHVLQVAGQAIGADHVQVFEHHEDAEEPIVTRFQWVREALAHRARALQLPEGGWGTEMAQVCRALQEGRALRGRAGDLTPEYNQILLEQDVEFTLVLPIFVGERYWGGLCFDALREGAEWTAAEAATLEILAASLGEAIGKGRGKSFSGAPGTAEARLHAQVVAQVSEAIVAVDADRRVTLLNPAAEALFGMSSDEAVGRPVARLFGPRVAGRNGKHVLHVFDALEPSEATLAVEQEGRHLEVSVTPLQVRSGAVAVIRDVTSRRRQARHLEHRSRIDRALVEVSQLLVSPGDLDLGALLRIVGGVMGADHVYLITVPPDGQPPALGVEAQQQGEAWEDRKPIARPKAARLGVGGWPSLREYTYHDWTAPGVSLPDASKRVEEEDLAAFAVPVLSSRDELYGYLGIEYSEEAPEWPEEDVRVINVLGDMISAYLERTMAEMALRESEERYRSFVQTVWEGIWCIELEAPLSVDASTQEQLHALREHGVVSECNRSMAHALEAEHPSQVIGKRAVSVIPEGFDESFFKDLVELGYNLRNREYSMRSGEASTRHFVASAIGTVEDGHLVRIWGSWTDVTERVELERRMVAALEHQQERIGRELHDGVGQLLTGVRMLSQNLLESHFTEGERGYDQARKIVRFAQEASQLARELQRGLAPVQIQEGELVPALKDLAGNINDLPGIACTFVHDGVTEVHEREAKLQLYRIAQEATNNALKHADPTYIQIVLEHREEGVALQVKDDGKGFDTRITHNGQSLGLHSMEYRARLVGAALTIASDPGQGARVQCLLPRSSA